MQPSRLFVPLAIAFEAALGVLGLAIAWLAGIEWQNRMQLRAGLTPYAALFSAIALLMLAGALRSRFQPLVRLRQQVEGLVSEAFRYARWWELALLSVAAGFGEELLFRGALQPLAERMLGAWAGLLLASALFGAVHAMSLTYFVVATIMGLYLGGIAYWLDDLVTPMAVHAIYDFIALVVLKRSAIRKFDADSGFVVAVESAEA